MNREVYLDNSATTKPFKEIIDEVGQTIEECYGNPSSLHNKGVDSEKILKYTRQIVAHSIGVNSGEIFFTSGGTESNNIAIQGFAEANKKRIGKIVTSCVEHPSVLKVFKNLEIKGFDVTYLPVDKDGIVDLHLLNMHLEKNHISLLSIMHVNNEVGSIQPIDEILKLKKQYGFSLHVDAVQSFCKIDLSDLGRGVDMLSFSGHKIHALKGVGGLYIRKGIRINPVYHGGGQEEGIKPGTENIPGIWSLCKAIEISSSKKYGAFKDIRKLKDTFVNRILNEIPIAKLNSSVDKKKSAPHIVNIAFEGIPGEVMLHSLEQKGIYVSTGSACSSKKKEPSYILTSMGVNKDLIKSSIRISLSLFTSNEDIDYCISAINESVRELKRFKQ